MPEKYHGQSVTLCQHCGQVAFVADGVLEKIAFSRKSQRVLVGKSVGAVVVALDDISARVKIAGELVVTRDMLCHAVDQLHDGFRVFHLVPDRDRDFLAVERGKLFSFHFYPPI